MEQDLNHISNEPNEPNEPNKPNKPVPQKTDTLTTLSLVAGIFAIICCCAPPLQLLIGVSAIMLAVLSKKGQPLSKLSRVGLILGVVSVISSFLIFFSFMQGMQILKDPANAEVLKPLLDQYQTMFESLQGTS